jgi:predicted  nucleic acid-binding Zn-ribbon protein
MTLTQEMTTLREVLHDVTAEVDRLLAEKSELQKKLTELRAQHVQSDVGQLAGMYEALTKPKPVQAVRSSQSNVMKMMFMMLIMESL